MELVANLMQPWLPEAVRAELATLHSDPWVQLWVVASNVTHVVIGLALLIAAAAFFGRAPLCC